LLRHPLLGILKKVNLRSRKQDHRQVRSPLRLNLWKNVVHAKMKLITMAEVMGPDTQLNLTEEVTKLPPMEDTNKEVTKLPPMEDIRPQVTEATNKEVMEVRIRQ
jgi:hypothetical protein